MNLYTTMKKTHYSPVIVCGAAIFLSLMTSCRGTAISTGTSTTTISKQDTCTVCVCNPGDVRCIDKSLNGIIPKNIPTDALAVVIFNSGIRYISKNDFLGLEQLQTLYIQKNDIAYIHPDAFRNLYKLTHLNLEQNRFISLDPTGRLFQHLVSLNYLFVDKSGIKKMNKFSFLTLGGAHQKLEVKLSENNIQCDCDVKALKNWQESLIPSRFTFKDFQCSNADGLAYNDPDIKASVFGRCTAAEENIFQTRAVCNDCDQQNTNFECRKKPLISCVGAQMVCSEKVEWDTINRKMKISSLCMPYQTCLSLEVTNTATCPYDSPSNRVCNFCCLGPTCDNSTIGGRTHDMIFEILYRKDLPYEAFMGDPDSSQFIADAKVITTGMTKILNGIEAGFDVYVKGFEPDVDRSHKVVVKIALTAFNVVPFQELESQIRDKLDINNIETRNFLMNQMYKSGSKLEIYGLSQGGSREIECPDENVETNIGTFVWRNTLINQVSHTLCPNSDHKFAIRKCQDTTEWAEADYSFCGTVVIFASPSTSQGTSTTTVSTTPAPTTTTPTTTTTPATTTLDPMRQLEKEVVTKDNALEISELLLNEIKNVESFTPQQMNIAVNILEKLVKEDILAQDNVPQSAVAVVSGLMDVDEETIREAQLQSSTSQRILKVVDDIGEKSPLSVNRLVIESPNVAIAAQGVNSQEARNVIMTENDSPSDNIEVDVKLRRQVPTTDDAYITVPVKAISDSLTAEQRQNLKRVSFASYKDDKLFYTPSAEEIKEEVGDDNDSDKPAFFKTQVASQIVAASVPGVVVEDLKENITTQFVHQVVNFTRPQCVSWKQSLAGGQGDWTSEGCGVVETSETHTVCGCNHLTNFALLMDVYQEGGNLSELDKKVLSIISYIGCGISLMALLLTLLTYSFFRKLRRDNPSKILINLCLALLLSNLVFVAGMQKYAFDNDISCKLVAVLLHYFLLASLTWMAVEAFYMYLALVRVFKTYFTNFILKCCLVGWGIPLVVTITTLAIDATDHYGFINNGICWLKNPAFYIAFVAPVCVILLINFAAFGLVIRQLMTMSSGKLTKTDRSSTISRLRGAIGVVILLGLSWIFGVFAIDSASVVVYYLFAIFNSLQGLFIFIFYCVLKKDVMASWKRSLPCFEEYGEPSKTSSNSRDSRQRVVSNHKAHDMRMAATLDLFNTSNSNEITTKNGMPSSKYLSNNAASATANTIHNVKKNINSDSSSANTMSTASTVASYSRTSTSNIYNTIDDSETEHLNSQTDFRSAEKSPEYPSPTSVHLLTSRIESQNQSPDLKHVYGNVPSKHQKDLNDAAPSNGGSDLPKANVQYSVENKNISIISDKTRQNEVQIRDHKRPSVDTADINVNVDSPSSPRVRDLRLQFDRRTSNTSDKEITRI